MGDYERDGPKLMGEYGGYSFFGETTQTRGYIVSKTGERQDLPLDSTVSIVPYVTSEGKSGSGALVCNSRTGLQIGLQSWFELQKAGVPKAAELNQPILRKVEIATANRPVADGKERQALFGRGRDVNLGEDEVTELKKLVEVAKLILDAAKRDPVWQDFENLTTKLGSQGKLVGSLFGTYLPAWLKIDESAKGVTHRIENQANFIYVPRRIVQIYQYSRILKEVEANAQAPTETVTNGTSANPLHNSLIEIVKLIQESGLFAKAK